MTIPINPNSQIGVLLADRLGLRFPRREGHDLAGACIACKSSDAFRLHQQTGVGHCYSCGGKWSPFHVAEIVLKDREQAKSLLVEIGAFEPAKTNATPALDPITAIARSKGITPESLRAFGAQTVSTNTIRLPAYGPDGKTCTMFTMSVQGGKGLFAKGRPAGLFFPHADGKVRLPQPGEVWHIVEGPKDAAALHGLGLLACGLNTCRLAAKFTRLFAGTNIILIPDRDLAGEEGSEFSARVLRGVAKSVRIAVLPAEFKDSDGADVRDVLRGAGGRDQVLQAITDARQPDDGWDVEPASDAPAPAFASAEIPLPNGDQIKLEVSPAGRQPQRLVVAIRGNVEHRDRLNTDSSQSRERFLNKLATKIGVERDILAPLVEPHLTKLAGEIDEKKPAPAGQGDDEAQSQATLAANMAADWDLWHTPGKDAYATITVNGHFETWAMKSQTFKRYVAKLFYDQTGEAMNSDALTATVNLLEAKALFDGEEHPVFVRLAEHEGNIYLDLCNESWQVVEITSSGWQIINEAPVRFRRSRSMLALPTPELGGHINLLRKFLNVDETAWVLIVAWLVAGFRPRGPYPSLALFAEHGAGKSTACRFLRDLIDPNVSPLRAEPKDCRDMMIAANNAWCLAYDNLSHVPPWLSDALCRLSTGGGFSTRELYTDQDEITFDSQRPVMLNSIEDVATRSDLLDRCLIVTLGTIEKDQRRPEAELIAEYQQVQPRILGALLDAISVALRRLPTIKLPDLPRMADFAVWATAAETAFGWASGTFMSAYQKNQDSTNEVALEASVIAKPLLDFLEHQGGRWEGTAGELLNHLEGRVSDQVKRGKGWPKNPLSLTGHLKRISPNMRKAGWILERDRTSKKRNWIIRRADDANETSSPPIAPSENGCNSVQTDAERSSSYDDDANDADDANPGAIWNPDRY